MMTPVASASVSGFGLVIVGLLLLLLLGNYVDSGKCQ